MAWLGWPKGLNPTGDPVSLLSLQANNPIKPKLLCFQVLATAHQVKGRGGNGLGEEGVTTHFGGSPSLQHSELLVNPHLSGSEWPDPFNAWAKWAVYSLAIDWKRFRGSLEESLNRGLETWTHGASLVCHEAALPQWMRLGQVLPIQDIHKANSGHSIQSAQLYPNIVRERSMWKCVFWSPLANILILLKDLNLFFFLCFWSEANGKQISSPDIWSSSIQAFFF